MRQVFRATRNQRPFSVVVDEFGRFADLSFVDSHQPAPRREPPVHRRPPVARRPGAREPRVRELGLGQHPHQGRAEPGQPGALRDAREEHRDAAGGREDRPDRGRGRSSPRSRRARPPRGSSSRTGSTRTASRTWPAAGRATSTPTRRCTRSATGSSRRSRRTTRCRAAERGRSRPPALRDASSRRHRSQGVRAVERRAS